MGHKILKFTIEGIRMFKVFFTDGSVKSAYSMRGIQSEILKKKGEIMHYDLATLEKMYIQACEIGLEYISEDTMLELKTRLDAARKAAK